jgi:hypothetical protein
MRCEGRTLEDIRALGENDVADERRFATVARVSETNLSLYRTFAQPVVRALTGAQWAEWVHALHPLRVQYEVFSDANPFMAPVAAMAQRAREDRTPSASDNVFVKVQEIASRRIVDALEAWRVANENLAERIFLSIYGSPGLQAAVGLDPKSTRPLRKAAKNPLHQQLMQMKVADLKSRIANGSIRECIIRSALYVGMARGSIDERGFELVRRLRLVPSEMDRLTLPEFKQAVREQYFMLLIDEAAALAAIPAFLPADIDERKKILSIVRRILSARGEITGEAEKRFSRIAQLFETETKEDRSRTAA